MPLCFITVLFCTDCRNMDNLVRNITSLLRLKKIKAYQPESDINRIGVHSFSPSAEEMIHMSLLRISTILKSN